MFGGVKRTELALRSSTFSMASLRVCGEVADFPPPPPPLSALGDPCRVGASPPLTGALVCWRWASPFCAFRVLLGSMNAQTRTSTSDKSTVGEIERCIGNQEKSENTTMGLVDTRHSLECVDWQVVLWEYSGRTAGVHSGPLTSPVLCRDVGGPPVVVVSHNMTITTGGAAWTEETQPQ